MKRNLLLCSALVFFSFFYLSPEDKLYGNNNWHCYKTSDYYFYCHSFILDKYYSFWSFASLIKDNGLSDYKKKNVNIKFLDYCLKYKRYQDINVLFASPAEIFQWLDTEKTLYKTATIFRCCADYANAYKYFLAAAKFNCEYHFDILYYLGGSAIALERYAEALESFTSLQKTTKYDALAKLNILYCYYRQNAFASVVNADLQLNDSLLDNECSLLKQLILADSALFLDKPIEAIELYNSAIKKVNNKKILIKILYRLGYLTYKNGTLGDAAILLQKVSTSSALPESLYALFYLGCINIKNKDFLAASFLFDLLNQKTATQLFINEHTLYNLILSLFMAKDYSNALRQITLYKSRYKDGKYLSLINELLSLTYLNIAQQNLAIDYLETIPQKNVFLSNIYQYIAIERAKDFFVETNYSEALAMTNKALANRTHKDNLLNALLLKMMICLALKNYDDLIVLHNSILEMKGNSSVLGMADYFLAYMFFNRQDYVSAIRFFKNCIRAKLRIVHINDIGLRLADSYYALKQYKEAIELYGLYMHVNPPHVLFYTALAQKGLNELQIADNVLNELLSIGKSDFYDKAILERARVNVAIGNYARAVLFYSQLVDTRSYLIFDALIERAVIFSNQKNYLAAKDDYLYVLNHSQNLNFKNSAKIGLKQVLMALNVIETFNDYLPLSERHDNMLLDNFEKGKLLFYNRQYLQALELLGSIIEQFRDINIKTQANFICAECCYFDGHIDKALEYYNKCLENENYFKTKEVLLRLAVIYESKRDFSKSLEYYIKLNKLAPNGSFIFKNSLEGMIRNSFHLKKYADSQLFIQNYSINNNLYETSSIDVLIIFAKIAIEQLEFIKATTILEKIIYQTTVKSAEAVYLLGLLRYKENKNDDSLNLLLSESVNFWRTSDFKNKIYLLIAKNYLAKKSLLQAKATLSSIIANCQILEILQEAKILMIELETLENFAQNKDIVGEEKIEN